MPSASSPIREAIEGYAAGRVKAERLVIAVAAAYYRDEGQGTRDGLGPLIEVIDRASPGIVELGGVDGGHGFDVRLAERPFPKHYEPDLKRAVEAYLASHRSTGVIGSPLAPGTGVGAGAGGGWGGLGGAPTPGVLGRLVAAMRRLFSPSA